MRRRSADPTTELPYIDKLLNESESADPQKAFDCFNQLCELGCDREILGWCLAWYSSNELKLGNGQVLNIHSLDSWEAALEPSDGGPPITRDELDQIAKRARKVLCDIRRIAGTPLIRHLVTRGIITSPDLLSSLFIPSGIFQGLIRLPTLLSKFGPRNKPDRSSALAKVCLHIKESTGRWHDERLAEIVNALTYDQNQDEPTSAQSLKQWRKRHGLIDKKGTRKAKK